MARASFHSDLSIDTPGTNEHALDQIVPPYIDRAPGGVVEPSEIHYSQGATCEDLRESIPDTILNGHRAPYRRSVCANGNHAVSKSK